MDKVREILEKTLFELSGYQLLVYQVLAILGIFILAKLVLWAIRTLLRRVWKRRKLDRGTEYAVFQIIRYILWIVAILLMLDVAGVELTVLLAGAAALLVGLALGLQQFFADLVSGLVLLFEGTIKVEDVIEVDGDVVRVKKIGLRTSRVMNRDDIILILPNSKIANEKVINWSHNEFNARFRIEVGVSYNSEVDLVMKVLAESAAEHPNCQKEPAPKARLIEFGDSALNFEVLFYSTNLFRIEQTKADIRANIARRFRENGIEIPFPQRDLHLRSSEVPIGKS